MVPATADPTAREEIEDLRENDREVLEFLSRDPGSLVGFQGIRRRLRIHPEKLSRALQRLARDELVDRTDLGYRVTPKALSILSPTAIESDSPGVPVLQTYLPAGTDLRGLVASLKGAWMGPLRWYGLSESEGEIRASWLTEDGEIQLDVRLRVGQLSITALVDAPDRLDEAARLAHQLFQHLSRGAFARVSG
ncbi:MAG: hypothetical protein A3K59_00515 [Euryarchaeota archaeon RBG_19FT_COMBO_69_17]|nr:MAG: hypothetical protein A3K59_00515 [Euryarchaeota archaeon RBG_19FT_COMBO_69_17]